MRKRMHPVQIAYTFFETLRNSVFIIVILFVLNWNNTSFLFKYGRWAFLLFLVGGFIVIILSWSVKTYELKDRTVHMYSGIFKKKHSSVPLERVQNIQRKTPFYFKIFKVTSLSLETGISDEGASMEFEAVTLEEADHIEQYLEDYRVLNGENEQSRLNDDHLQEEMEEPTKSPPSERTVHYNPTKKEVFKAAFLSLSFLAIIPILLTVYVNADRVIDVEEKAEGMIAFLMDSWLIMAGAVIFLIFAAIIGGMIHAYLKYGKYEISSDEDRIYIRSGVLNEKSFSISKSRVQAVQVNQPVLKKLLGLAEVRLISASTGGLGQSEEVSSLYPFLPINQAYSVLEEILPTFEIEHNMKKLSKKSLYIKMIRVPWLFLFATIFVITFKPGWWYGLPVIFAVTYLMRFFQYRNTRYMMHGPYIQFKVGGLSSTLFITTRQKITEISVKRSFLQKKFNLATISTYNRTRQFHLEMLADLPTETSNQFVHWYGERLSEIEIEQGPFLT